MIAAMTVAAPAVAVGEQGIARAMAASASGWNAGDLDRFVAIYAEDAVYVTARGVIRGRAAIAVRYRPSFAHGGNTRGRLTFRPLVERAIDGTHRLLIARRTLTGRKVDTGMTTLLFERRGDEWKIVADHSN